MADQTKRILYMTDSGVLAVICPGLKETRTVEEIAKKDVPTGKKYQIVNSSEVPTVRTFRNAWEINESELTDGVGD